MKNLIACYLLLCVSSAAIGQLKEMTAVDAVFSDWDKPNTPGGAVGIIQDGKLMYAKGYGIADLEHDVKITPSSVFYIGSVSKQFVTFCILLLEEQEKLDLDDNIQKYFPDFPEYGSPLTIRHFIHHTSGVRDYLTLMFLKGRNYLDEISVEEVYELIKRQAELNFTPGDQYLYSNSCYFMLALIVEQVSGESIRNFAKKNIFDPLGMMHSQFYDDNTDLIKNRVFSYEVNEEKEMGFNNLINRFELVGSGGVYSTIEDLYLWDQNFYHNKLGKGGQAIITKMHQEGILNNGESSGYAFAINNGEYRGLKTVSHGGALAGFRSHLVRFPEQKFSVVIVANRADANPGDRSYQLADIFLKDKLAPVPPRTGKPEAGKEAAAELSGAPTVIKNADYPGNYFCEELDVSYSLFEEDNVLKVKIPSMSAKKFEVIAADQLTADGITFYFTRENGKVTGFRLDAGRVKNLSFVKK